MTKRRHAASLSVLFAAFGLASALLPSAAGAVVTTVATASTAPYSVDGSASNVPVLILDISPSGGPASLGFFNLSLFGDVPPQGLTAKVWQDTDLDNVFNPGVDTQLGAAGFNPATLSLPAYASINATGGNVGAGTTRRHWVTVSFQGVPPARKLAFGFRLPADISASGFDGLLPFPVISSATITRLGVFANPVNGLANYPYPVGGSIRSGGLDTGLFLRAGQRVQTAAVPGDQWSVPASVGPNGGAGFGVLGGFPKGALVGRIGGGPWFQMGLTSTVTATSAGPLYVAAEDDDWTDNSGVIRAVFEILPSTTPKRWVGGTLGFETASDIDANWIGGRPYNGERAVFYASSYDCDWNLNNVALLDLYVSTAFTRAIRLTTPPFQAFNRITTLGDAVIQGGSFHLGLSTSGSQYVELDVRGKLVARDSATFVMNGGGLYLGLGAEFRDAARLINPFIANVYAANPSAPYYFRVHQATVNATGNMNLSGLDFLELSTATILAFDNVQLNGYPTTSTNALVKLGAGPAPVNWTFNNWSSVPPARSNGVSGSFAAGSNVVFFNAMSPSGNSFGTPRTSDPSGSVKWFPDGGGTPGSITGTINSAGGTSANFRVIASTSPKGHDFTGVGGGGGTSVALPGSGVYSVTGLRAPSTYFLFAYIDDGGTVGAHSERGGHGHSGGFRSEPVFVPSGGGPGGINIQMKPWGAVQGTVVNDSLQHGPIVVETWENMPNLLVSTRHARGVAAGGSYLFQSPADFGGVLHSSAVFAFVDSNQNGFWDTFEASATVNPVSVAPLSTTTVNLTIQGGNPAPGGSVALATAAAHLGFVASAGPTPLIRSRMSTTGSPAHFAGMRVRFQGGPQPVSGGQWGIWLDDGDAKFDAALDSKVASEPMLMFGPSTYTVLMSTPVAMPAGSTKDFFLTFDLNDPFNSWVSSAGVMIDAATSYFLSAGTFTVTPGFPSQTGALQALVVVRASETVTADLQGGVQLPTFLFPEAYVSVVSTGQWRVSPSDPLVGPGGYPGTTGLNTVLPSANLGELIGRVSNGGYGGYWQRIGASTTPFAAGALGVLRLAVNDYVGAYGDNSGAILAGFTATGSSVGALSGQVFYSTPVAGTLTVTARLNGTTPSLSTSLGVAAATSYAYAIQGLTPGSYDLDVTHGSSSDFGRSVQKVSVAAGATGYLDAVMFQATAAISGAIFYTGTLPYGEFRIGASTTTNFTGNVNFFGGYNGPSTGAYTINSLPAPATYYLVGFRDGNNDGRPGGPEPLGYHGAPGAGLFSLGGSLTPVYLTGLSSSSVNVTLTDTGGIEGSALLAGGATGHLVVEAGRGSGPGGYAVENRLVVPFGSSPPPGGVPFNLGLLRPATGYTLFAFLDKNLDGQPSAGEEQFTSSPTVAVPAGGLAHLSFPLVALSSPAAPAGFAATPALVSTITFSWSLTPGATGYQLRRAGGSVLYSLGAAASNYFDVLPDNTSSQIRSITASNGNGTSTTSVLPGPVYSPATGTNSPTFSAVSSSGALVSWTSSNPPGTLYDLRRSSFGAVPGARVYLGTAPFFFSQLAPASTYFWTVRAINGNGLPTAFCAIVSTVTPPLSGPALSGALGYFGLQTQGGAGLVVEASTSPTTFFPRVSSAALAGGQAQPFYLPVPAGTYHVRAFVDQAGNGILQANADRGQAGPFTVTVSSVDASFSIAIDTVPPGAPAGLVAVGGSNQVSLSWAAPTKSANGGPLLDLAGYRVERSTSAASPFLPVTSVDLSSAVTVFVDTAALPGQLNLYRVRSVDLGVNVSSPSGAVSAFASAGGSISGAVRNFSSYTGTGDGMFRVRLTTSPASSAVSVAEVSVETFSFTGLADGTYFVRTFRDINNNGVEDLESEPAGTFGGINQPFPIAILNGNSVTGVNPAICNRSPLTPPSVSGTLLSSGCPAVDKGPGFTTSLFAFRAGGGSAGSFGVGSQLNLAMSTATAFASEIIVVGPQGNVIGRDNRQGGANLTVTLSQPGVYFVEPTSFLVGGTGAFTINARVEGGFAGVISGTVSYAGARPGLVYTQVFGSQAGGTVPILTSTAASPGAFSFSGLPDGQYFLRTFRDANGNGVRDIGEPSGQYGVAASSSLPIFIYGGLAVGSPYALTLTDPAAGVVRGAALYEGSGTGPLRVEVGVPGCPGCSSIKEVVAFTTVAAGAVYDLPFIPSATDYVVRAVADFNGNGRQDALEPAVSSFPVSVYFNQTSTVSLVVRDAGAGAPGGAVVVGTVAYAGASTGPIMLGLSRDPKFHSIDYLIVLPATGAFSRAGLAGDATYYMAGFIDTNLNNNPDETLGEPAGAGAPFGFAGVPDVDNPPEIFVSAAGLTTVQMTIDDPPNASMQGVARYAGALPASAPLVVRVSRADIFDYKSHDAVIARSAGVSTYSFRVDYLAAAPYFVSAFIDANANGQSDIGEPFGSRQSVSLSSGAGSFPYYGADVEVRDPGSLGAAQAGGRIRGEMIYLGTQSGPMYVRFFNNEERLGSPLYTLRVPATGNPAPGSGEFVFDRQNLPFGTYWLDAFRDPSDSGVYNPAAHAHGTLNSGQSVELTSYQPERSVFGGSISDPGQGGSVNRFTGSFASAEGVRFDGGASDLGASLQIDSTTLSGPQPVVLGVTAQNGGVEVHAVRFSSTGVMLASTTVSTGDDLQISQFAIDPSGFVYLPGRQEQPGNFFSTGTITVYDQSFVEQNYAEFPGYQGLDGLSYAAGSLYAASRYAPAFNEVRALKINPGTLATIATGYFTGPGNCANCNARVQGSAVSPDGSIFMVYGIVNQEGDGDRGLHFLLKFDSAMNLVASRDVTALGAPSRGSGINMAVSNSGAVYMAFTQDGNTARTHKFDASGGSIVPGPTAAYGPILVHFNGGIGNVRLDPATGGVYEVWESTTGAGDYMLLRYDASLNLIAQRFYDGHDGTLADTAFSLDVYNSSMVFVAGSVNNGQNLDWGVIRLNANASGSQIAPGTPVVITTANAFNYIAGTAAYAGSLITSGTIRMTLIPFGSDVPVRFATAPFGASRPFLFNNIPDGFYDVRVFADPNGNLTADEGEPLGATTLAGIEFSAETGSQALEDAVQLCDRRQISFGVQVVHSLSAADCTSPDRPGAPRRLYTFRGTRGQPVSIRMKAVGFYDSYLDLYGPDGDWLEYDDDGAGNGDAEIVNYVLPEDGVYTIDAGAYASGSFGQFRLDLAGTVGSLGSISGSVNYAGTQGGSFLVGLFDSTSFSTASTVGRLVLVSTRAFAFDGLRAGTTYYLGAFIDTNANLVPDQGEDSGVFGTAGTPTPIYLASGQSASGLEIAVVPSSASAASSGYVTGVVSYLGSRPGSLVLEFWSSAQFSGRPVASRVVPTGAGSYDVAVPGGQPYYVRAYIDVNGDFALGADEPRGVYEPFAQGAESVYVPVAQTVVGVNAMIRDPGQTAGGVFAGEGTAVLDQSSLTSGGQASLTIVYTAGPNGLAGTSGGTPGQVGFTVPPGFPFPFNSVSGSSVTATSTGTALSAVTYSGPSAFVTMNGVAGLAPGQTVRFQFTNFYVPCQIGAATFTVSAVQIKTSTITAQPLFSGSPSLGVVAGPPAFAGFDEPYFAVKQDELSEVRRVVAYDNCGNRVPVTAPKTIELAGRFFNGSSFVTDPDVGLTTSTALSTASAVTLDFAVGQSSRPFYVVSASTGFKYLEVHSTIGAGATYYFGVNAVPANALSSVSVSTASGGAALSSATIGLGSGGLPNQVFINFTLGDPQQSWHVLISSLPFKAGERPSAVWERWGYGQPNPGEVAWDGRFSPWISGGVRAPNGLYYGRVQLAGGGVKDDNIRVTVALPQLTGRAFDPGTVPSSPLGSVQLRVYGPSGYFTAATASDGSYALPGLGAGNYRVQVTRADYVDGAADMTLNASGAVTAFVSRTLGIAVSSNAAAGLDFYIARAPRLTVVPSLDASVGAAAADQWGNLQVRPSTAIALSTFYGPMRLKGGTTTFDDGGQWDPATQQFVTRTILGFNVPVGSYTVLADLNGYSRSSAAVYVGPDGARVDLPAFLPKAVISGTIALPAPAPAGGVSVGITAAALSTGAAASGLSGGAFVNPGQTSAAFSISGFDPGAYLLKANTQGLSASTTGPIVVAGTAAVTGVHFSTFAAGATISGTVTAGGAANGTKIFINAWSPGSFNFGSTVVYTAGGAAAYSMPGLDAGATYQLYANIDAQGADYDLTFPAGGFPIKVSPPATQNFTLSPASGVVAGTIHLPAGSTDFLNVFLYGRTIASLRPDEVGKSFVDVSTTLPNFLCGDGSAPAGLGYCPAGVSSATFRVQGVNTQTLDIRFLHSTTGQSSRQTVSVVNGSTFTLVADLRSSTFTISGFIVNQIADTYFNTNAKIVANAPYIAPPNYPPGLSSTTARVLAVRQEIDSFGVAISTVFDPISTRVGFLDASGGFSIPNCPNGSYVVRTAELRSCATCPVIAPPASRAVLVNGVDVSSVSLTVSNGYSVSGSISLDGGLLDARVFDVSVYNRRQELVRSTQAYLGDVSLGATANSVDYSFSNLPAGEFYTLVVRGLLFPVKYVGRPIRFPDPALSPSGLQSSLTRQDVLMQRAGYATGRLKDGVTGELINAQNATLLAPNFRITATANPWTEGGFVTAASSVSGRPIETDGYFRVGPLLPGVSYDLRLAQTNWDPNFLANGSQNYAPVTIGGVKLTAGEIRDLGVIALGQGLSVTGVVRSTATGLGLGNVKVTGKPSFGGDDLLVQTFTNQNGGYALWVSTVVSNQFTITAAPRGGNQASDGKYYGQVTLANVNLQTQTSANFLLTPLSVTVTGQIQVPTGDQLSYPFGDKRGFPAAAINLQPAGVVPDNPLGDIEAITDQSGNFSVPGLSTGLYVFHATSLGFAVYNATVSVSGSSFSIFTGTNTPAAPITLTRGATATGRIIKSDGSSPNSSEVVGVAAANFGAGEFVVGSVEVDPVAKTVGAYTISGFKTGTPYNIVLLSGSGGKEVSFPPEGAGVLFTAAESTTTKTINLTYRPAAMDCLGVARALDAARTQFSIQVDCLKPLRQETALDDDLTQILSVSTFTSANAAVTAPNGTGALSARLLSSDRRRLTAVYTLGASEARFSMRVRASAAEIDPRTGDNFAVDKVFDFYAGLDSHADGRVTNIDGGAVTMQPSAQDELLGLDERSRIDLRPGSFGEGSDSLADSAVVAQPTTTVNVSMTKGRDQTLAKALSIATLGYAPAALEVPDTPSAFPAEMWAAMSKYRTQASTTQVGGANPISAFYSIFLPAGIRHQLKKNADLTLSYNLAASTSTNENDIQVWFYNAVLGRFVVENVNRRLDTVNKTITVSVDHFSTFVVLDSTPVLTSDVTFGGQDIAVANFPNPADCIVHSNIARNSTLFGAGGVHAPFTGTMIRTSLPHQDSAPLKINIYTVTGEKIRTIPQGDLPGARTYYTPWDCRNESGQTIASGVYIGEVVHGGRRKFFKIAIIRGSGL